MIHHIFFFLCFFSTIFASQSEDRLSMLSLRKSSPNIISVDSSSTSTGEEQRRKLHRKKRYLTTSSPRDSSDASSEKSSEKSSDKSPNRSPKMLLRRQKSPDHSSDQEKKQINSSLIKAVLDGKDVNTVKGLLEKSIYPNQRNHHNYNALHYACMTNAYDIVELLLNDERIDASVRDNQGFMAHDLLKTTTPNCEKIRNKLLRNVVLHCDKFSNMHYFDIKELVKENAVNTTDEEGTSPLIWATCSNQKEMVTCLLSDHPVDVNHADKLCGTALHYASLLGLPEIFTLLLTDYRTNTLIKNSFDQTPEQCVNKSESKICRAMHHALFTRSQLIEVVKDETFAVLMEQTVKKFPSEDNETNSKLVSKIIEYIHLRMDSVKQHQSTDMPEEGVPSYATNEFLEQLIYFQYKTFTTASKK